MIATRLNVTNTTELRKNGINALKTALGVTEETEPSDAEIREMFGF